MAAQDQIRHLFEYRENGRLYWRNPPAKGPRKAGDIAGGPCGSRGSWMIRFDYRPWKASRAIWTYHNGDIPDGLVIDHINRDCTDDRIENLRVCTLGENALNRTSGINCKVGRKGISPGRNGRYRVSVSREYPTIEAAIEARNRVALALHGDHAHLD
jgi:HNH endonuclease